MIISNESKGMILAYECNTASSFLQRLLGLMGKSDLPKGQGLYLTPCNSIHMFFMKIPLDIVFIDSSNVVVHLIENIKPWNVSKIVFNAYSVIELPVGTIASTFTSIGDKLSMH